MELLCRCSYLSHVLCCIIYIRSVCIIFHSYTDPMSFARIFLFYSLFSFLFHGRAISPASEWWRNWFYIGSVRARICRSITELSPNKRRARCLLSAHARTTCHTTDLSSTKSHLCLLFNKYSIFLSNLVLQ